ncbi:MAG: hypothetical protein CMA31_04465 [Euryarchaeota archaeon]|nr:hypothetical protein [Euryarchaeota archaeon]|tara:strand:+ start:4490 stop:5344 length:855 start_codon:yes stop_codon:yes gene_type:complete
MASKPILMTGGVICLISASLLLVAGAFTNEGVESLGDLEEIDYNVYDYYYPSTDNGTHHVGLLEFIDEDRAGSLPWAVMVGGYYSDTNGDAQIDVCEGLRMEIYDSNGTNVTDENIGILKCGMSNEDSDPEDDDLVTIGFICDTLEEPRQNCMPGQTFKVLLYDENNSSIPFTLYDSDASIIAFFEIIGADAAQGITALVGASLIGFASCCGMVFGFIIFLIGLLIGSNPPQEVQFVHQSPNPMSINADGNDLTVTQLKIKDQVTGELNESRDGEWWDEIVKDE